jgi:prophage regulatory protein
MTDRFVLEEERRRITATSRTRWFLLEREGKAPARCLIGKKRVAWLESELTAWMAARTRVSARPMGAPPAPQKGPEA